MKIVKTPCYTSSQQLCLYRVFDVHEAQDMRSGKGNLQSQEEQRGGQLVTLGSLDNNF